VTRLHQLARAALVAATATIALLIGSALILVFLPPRAPSFSAVQAAYVPSDAWLLDRHGVTLGTKRIRYDVRRLEWVPLSEVSPALVTAIVAGEDQDFWHHYGIEWHSILGALRDQLWRHRRRGASTITMQLASLLQQRSEKTGLQALIGKIQQMRMAHALESRWTKPQILEAYLNLLGYEGDLQGISAASTQLAGKAPSGLSVPESLILAAMLPQPGSSPQRILARACLRGRGLSHPATCDAVRAAADTLLFGRAPSEPMRVDPHLAPQLAAHLLRQPGERVTTTIDAAVQRLAIDILRSHLIALSAHNVRDGAVIVVDNASGEVLAYVGSSGPQSHAQDVDGVLAPRQAGSTLKPFLYEMALERRYLTASSLLMDSPVSLDTASGVYLPQDYDHDFKGLVSVRTALASSLNVPAVRTLVLVGVEEFRNRLHDLGYSNIHRDGEYYGYSLALGSAEVTLWQQAQAYRALARGGMWSPLTLLPAQNAEASGRLLQSEASFVVGDILSDPAARAVTFGLDNHLATSFWTAVKTGTSEDMRDNWCIGFSRQFTVAVWVGNFEGDSMQEVSGVTGAAPIWHDLMAALHTNVSSRAPEAPPGLVRQLTRFSPAVEADRREWYLGGTAPRAHSVAAVPASVRPGIESPANGMIIAIDPDIPAENQKVLIAVKGARPSMRLRLNDELLGSPASEILWEPRAGAYYLTLEDQQGTELDRILFTVRGLP